MVEILAPLLEQLGVGGVAGLCVGYSLKKLGKLIAIIIGFFFFSVQLLAWKGMISINYDALLQWGNQIIRSIGLAEGTYGAIIANMPFATSFLVGFAIGLKMG